MSGAKCGTGDPGFRCAHPGYKSRIFDAFVRAHHVDEAGKQIMTVARAG
jgi:hypothetical protein